MTYLDKPPRQNFFLSAWITCDRPGCDEISMTDDPANRYRLADTLGRVITENQFWLEISVEQIDPWVTKYMHFCCDSHARGIVTDLRALKKVKAVPVKNWTSEDGINHSNFVRGIDFYADKYNVSYGK